MLKTCCCQQHTVLTPLVRTNICPQHVYQYTNPFPGVILTILANMMRYGITPLISPQSALAGEDRK